MINEKMMKKFCSKEKGLGIFPTYPYDQGEYRYAADGHIIIRVRIAEERVSFAGTILHPQKYPVGLSIPRLEDPWQLYPQGEEYMDVPGSTSGVQPCSDCDGKGNGCSACFGSGLVPTRAWEWVGNAVISEYYLAKIKMLSGAQIARAKSPVDPVHFRFNGGDGWVVPLKIWGGDLFEEEIDDGDRYLIDVDDN